MTASASGRYVAVIGGYEVDDDTLRLAERLGRLLAERSVIVVTGGRSGVSEAVSKGAFEAGGATIGILPGRDRAEANPWLTAAVATGLGETRNALVAMNGEVVVAFDGAYGTLSELAFALLDGKPVVGLGTWDLPDRGPAEIGIVKVHSPEDAAEAVIALLNRT